MHTQTIFNIQHDIIYAFFKQCSCQLSSYTRTNAVSYDSTAMHHDVYDAFSFPLQRKLMFILRFININKSASEKYKHEIKKEKFM